VDPERTNRSPPGTATMSPTGARIRKVTAPTLVMKTHLARIAPIMSLRTVPCAPAPRDADASRSSLA
jgi:hypothetical protein